MRKSVCLLYLKMLVGASMIPPPLDRPWSTVILTGLRVRRRHHNGRVTSTPHEMYKLNSSTKLLGERQTRQVNATLV